MRADLHLHSTASDGELSPEQLVARAAERGLTLVALTDHDSTAGVPEAQRAARGLGVSVVPGVELSATRDGREIHVLGYGLDPLHPAIVERGRRARSRRRERMESMVRRLRRGGIAVSLDDVDDAAGSGTMLGRPHLARALVATDQVGSVDEAFDRWIGDHAPAFVPTDLGSPEQAIQTIVAAGGLPVWAHPPTDLLSEWLDGLVDAGLIGLEAFRASWSPGRRRRVARAGRSRGLCLTGGSDWHGPSRGGRLGDFWLSADQIRDWLDRLGALNQNTPDGH